MLTTVTMLAPTCARNHACPERLRRRRFAGPATLRARVHGIMVRRVACTRAQHRQVGLNRGMLEAQRAVRGARRAGREAEIRGPACCGSSNPWVGKPDIADHELASCNTTARTPNKSRGRSY